MTEPPVGSVIRLNHLTKHASGIWERGVDYWYYLEMPGQMMSWEQLSKDSVDIQIARWEPL